MAQRIGVIGQPHGGDRPVEMQEREPQNIVTGLVLGHRDRERTVIDGRHPVGCVIIGVSVRVAVRDHRQQADLRLSLPFALSRCAIEVKRSSGARSSAKVFLPRSLWVKRGWAASRNAEAKVRELPLRFGLHRSRR